MTTKEEATEFFDELFYGNHHLPSEVKPFGAGWSVTMCNSMATFDYNNLTRLVFLAHKHCFRAEIQSVGINRIKLAIWKRQREGSMCQRHPTLEEAIAEFK